MLHICLYTLQFLATQDLSFTLCLVYSRLFVSSVNYAFVSRLYRNEHNRCNKLFWRWPETRTSISVLLKLPYKLFAEDWPNALILKKWVPGTITGAFFFFFLRSVTHMVMTEFMHHLHVTNNGRRGSGNVTLRILNIIYDILIDAFFVDAFIGRACETMLHNSLPRLLGGTLRKSTEPFVNSPPPGSALLLLHAVADCISHSCCRNSSPRGGIQIERAGSHAARVSQATEHCVNDQALSSSPGSSNADARLLAACTPWYTFGMRQTKENLTRAKKKKNWVKAICDHDK